MAGYTLPEIIVVVAVLGMAAALSAAAWTNFLKRAESQQAARMTQKFAYQARMLSVYRGVNHFLVLDPVGKTMQVREDSTAPFGRFNEADVRVASEPWPTSVELAMPPGVSSLPNPLGGADLTDAWTLPAPDSTQAWGSTLLGVMATPRGLIDSAESAPAVVSAGVILFSDNTGVTTSVGIRGQSGIVRSYKYDGASWKEIGSGG